MENHPPRAGGHDGDLHITLPQTLRIAKPMHQSGIVNLIQWISVVGYVTITDLTRVINNTASRTMQPLLTISIGMLIYPGLSCLVYGIFALTDRGRRRRAGTCASFCARVCLIFANKHPVLLCLIAEKDGMFLLIGFG